MQQAKILKESPLRRGRQVWAVSTCSLVQKLPIPLALFVVRSSSTSLMSCLCTGIFHQLLEFRRRCRKLMGPLKKCDAILLLLPSLPLWPCAFVSSVTRRRELRRRWKELFGNCVDNTACITLNFVFTALVPWEIFPYSLHPRIRFILQKWLCKMAAFHALQCKWGLRHT